MIQQAKTNQADVKPVAILLLERLEGNLDPVAQALPGVSVYALPLEDVALAPDLISRERVSVVFSDSPAQVSPAGTVAQQLQRVHPDLAIVQVVAEGATEAVLEAFRTGASDVLPLPLTPTEICGAFARVRDKEWLQRDLRQLHLATRRAMDELVLFQSNESDVVGDTGLDRLMARLTNLVQEALKVEIVSLMLADDAGNLEVRAATGLPDEVLHQKQAPDKQGVARQVYASGQPILVDDLETDGRFARQHFSGRYRTRSLLSVPVACHGEVFGVLNVNNKESGETFVGSDLELLQSIAHQAALAIENFRLVKQIVEQTAEIERMQNDLLTFHRDRARFVSSLSHELKTPLTSVIGFADLMLELFDQLEPDKLKDYLASIHGEALQLESLLSGMLRMFSIDSDSEQWRWEPLDLAGLVREAAQRFDVVMAEKELGFELQHPEDLQPVWGAADKVALLLDALFDNTIRYNQLGGTLRVVLENVEDNDDGQVRFTLTSQGQGFPVEDAETFLSKDARDGFKGIPAGIVGISLATCRAILHKLQGRIVVEESDGKRTVLGFLLPTRRQQVRKGLVS